MLVYRVELPDGTGPWCNTKGDWHTSYNTPIEYRKLSSWSDPVSIDYNIAGNSVYKDPKGTWRFGFTSWEQFFNYCRGGVSWRAELASGPSFKENKIESLNIIKNKGMVISVYEIADLAVMKDNRQCVFRIAEATLVERLDSLSDVVMEQLSIYLGEPTKKEKDEQEAGDASFIRYPGHQTNYEGITI